MHKFEKELKEVRPDSMTVSIDGVPKTHTSFRKTDTDFKKTLYSIDFFKKIGVKVVGVTTTVNKKTLIS